jgi:hypothetical protein
LSAQLARALQNGDRNYLEVLEQRGALIRQLHGESLEGFTPEAAADLRQALEWGVDAMMRLRDMRETARRELSSALAGRLLLSGLSAGNPVQYDGLDMKA